MSRRNFSLANRWLTIAMLLVLLVTSVSIDANASGSRDAETTGSGAEPNRIIRTNGAKPGIYNIDYLNDFYILDPNVFPVDGSIGFWIWSTLNPVDGNYNWNALDTWIKKRVDQNLGTGIMISTYDTSTANDIRSTPNWVIKIPDAVIPATTSTGVEHYIDYFHRTRRKHLNGEFDDALSKWSVSGDAGAVSVVATPPNPDTSGTSTSTLPDRRASGPALKLGDANSINATVIHDAEAVPAMPASLAGKRNVYVSARVNISTTDPNPNDHLYMEVWEGNTKLGGTEVDINNLSHAGQPADYWKPYYFDITSFATEKNVKVVFRVVTDSASPTTFYVDNVQLRVRHLIPKYWGTAYNDQYKKFITALGARYKTNNDLQFIAMGTGAYGESQPTQDIADWEYNSTFDHVVKAAGMDTTGEWQAYVNSVSLAFATAFAGGDGTGPARHLLLQYAPSFMSAEEKGYTSDYAAGLGIGLSFNRLSPEWTQIYRNDRGGGYDPIRLHWNSVPIAFEAYYDELSCSPLLSYWALMSAVEKHADYIRTDPTLLRDGSGNPTVHKANFNWARQYLGKTVQNTPRVWTVMREHRNPSMLGCNSSYYLSTQSSIYPQYGNFNYWLYQVDTITGGKTVAETNDKGADSRYAKDPASGAGRPEAGLGNCPDKAYSNIYLGNPPTCNKQPYNPDLPALVGQNPNDYTDFYRTDDWTGGGKEAYVVRRTDQATNNPYMFFRIDDGYIAPGTQVYSAKLTVGYFDIGTDQWSLKYDSSSGEKVAGTITKGNTKTYKEYVVTVNDAKFANGLTGGSDFYLDSRSSSGANDGNEWVHKVEVEKLGSVIQPTDTPTPTATATQTATPTVTPTATPTTGVVEGRAFNDANQNGVYDAGETLLSGAVMALLNAGNVEVYTTTSGADGVYRFAAVNPAQYKLLEKTPPPGYLINPNYAAGVMLLVNANQTLTGLDVGHQPQATPTATATATVTLTSTPTATGQPPTVLYRTYLPLVLR